MNLNRLIFFTSLVEAGSFTAAGDKLGVAKAVVSHQLAKLESELGVTLVIRTTRQLRVTPEGRSFYERCVAILREAESACDELRSQAAEPSGTLTLTAPLDYGVTVVAPVIAAYRRRFPQVRCDLTLDDGIVDLADGKVDLAIRVGWLLDTSSRARRVGAFEQYLVATPELADGFATTLTPDILSGLPWVENAALRHPLRWTFAKDHLQHTVEMSSAVRADKTPAAYACVLAGLGISAFPDYMVADDISAGRLTRIMADWTLPSGGIHIVLPASRFQTARVRRFIEMIQAAEKSRRSR